MTEIYLYFMFAHYGLYGNAPVRVPELKLTRSPARPGILRREARVPGLVCECPDGGGHRLHPPSDQQRPVNGHFRRRLQVLDSARDPELCHSQMRVVLGPRDDPLAALAGAVGHLRVGGLHACIAEVFVD